MIPNRDLEAVITKLKNAKAAEAEAAAEAKAAAALKQSWIIRDDYLTFTPLEQKSAKDWIAEVRRDAKKQKDPDKKALLEDLARDTTALLKASSKALSKKHSSSEGDVAIRRAKEELEETIKKIDKSSFVHVEKEKYSAGKIALAIATMGISIAIVGVKEKKIEEKKGHDITSKLTEMERPRPH